jgi:hypothetical protein
MASQTIFPAIKLEGGAPSKTAIYFPDKYQSTNKLDMIVYLHGLYVTDIETYLQKPHYQLREVVEKSGKNLVFVAPQLGASCESGRLSTAPDDYLKEVIQEIVKQGTAASTSSTTSTSTDSSKSTTPTLSLNKLILAAHSGGGRVMLEMGGALSTFKSNLKECWGFDSMYQPTVYDKAKKIIENEWVQFANNNSGVKLYFYYYAGDTSGTRQHSTKLKSLLPGMPQVQFEATTADELKTQSITAQELKTKPAKEWGTIYHESMPLSHFADRIQSAFP